MPCYDYICLNCSKHFDVFMTFSEYGTRRVTCPNCNSRNVRRGIPRVRMAKSEESRLDDLSSDFSDPSALAGLENDPRAMGRMMRKMGKEMGEDFSGEDFEQMVGEVEGGDGGGDADGDGGEE